MLSKKIAVLAPPLYVPQELVQHSQLILLPLFSVSEVAVYFGVAPTLVSLE